MKKVLIIMIMPLLLWSCKTVTLIPRDENIYQIDFSKYSSKGFLFTPERYEGKYESIGLIDYVLLPESKLKTPIEVGHSWHDDVASSQKYWETEKIDVQTALNAVYNHCISMGANAFVNLEITPENKDYLYLKPPTIIIGIRIKGYAIKRIE